MGNCTLRIGRSTGVSPVHLRRGTGEPPVLHSFGVWAILVASLLVFIAGEVRAADGAPSTAPAALPSLDEVIAKLPHFTIAGKVVDKSGQAVEAADVLLYYPGVDYILRGRLVAKVKSGPDGAFRFENAGVWEPPVEGRNSRQSQEYCIIARHPKHGIEFAVLLRGEATENVLVRMQEPLTYKVVVKDTAGKPVAGAQVCLFNGQHADAVNKLVAAEHPKDARQHQYLSLGQDIGASSGVTDANGTASLLGPPDAGFMAIKDGYAKGMSGDANIVLCPGARVSGKVTWPDGSPAGGVAVLFEYQSQRLGHYDATTTDAQGRYHFDHLPGSGFYWSGIPPEAQKGQGTGMLRVQDLRPGSKLTSTKIAFPINPGDDLTKDLVFQQAIILAGRVVDFDTGQPLSGISLYRYIQTPGAEYLDSTQMLTDAEGRFSTSVPPGAQVSFQWQRATDGSYLIDTEWQRTNPNGGYQPFREQSVTKDRSDLLFRLKLIPLQDLTGRVVDEKGQAVRGAAIYSHPELKEARSDATGAFTLKAFKNRDFDLCAVTNDMKLGALAHIKSGATQATLTLAPTADYDGQVSTPDNLPARKLKFYMDLRINGQNLYRVRAEPTTDDKGNFKARSLIPGATYYAWWSSDNDQNRDYDYGNATIELSQVKPGEPIRFKATQFLNALMGKVVDDKGQPIAGATVDPGYSNLMPQDARNNRKPIATDAKGEFTLSRLAPGTITLRIAAKGRKTGSFKAPTDSVDFVATLKGADEPCVWDIATVDEAGKPIIDVPLVLWERVYIGNQSSASTRDLRTDGQGKLHLAVPPRSQRRISQAFVAADLPGYDLSFAQLTGEEDVDATLALRRSAKHWRGIAVDENQKPLAGATIRVTGHSPDVEDYQSHVSLYDPADENADLFHLSLNTDDQGRFELSRLSQFWTNITIAAPSYAPLHTYFDPRQDKQEKTFALSPGARLKGRLSFAGQAPPPGGQWTVSLLQVLASGGYSSGGSTKASADWTFSFDSLAPGKYEISAGSQDKGLGKYRMPDPITVETAARQTTEIVLKLEEGILLRGKLVIADGKPAAQGYILVSIKGDQANGSGRSGRAGAQTDPDGSWEMYVPRAGQYEIQYHAAGMEQMRTFKTLTVEKGKPIEPMIITIE